MGAKWELKGILLSLCDCLAIAMQGRRAPLLLQSIFTKEMFTLKYKHCVWMCSGALKCFFFLKSGGLQFYCCTPRNLSVYKSSVKFFFKINKFKMVVLV